MQNNTNKNNLVTAEEALKRLKVGNERFINGNICLQTLSHHDRRQRLQASQSPFAIVLGCSDSRVPLEFIFDQGLGDLFVIRVAGNIVAPSLVGSVEFAAATFNTQLVVVLGHSNCGAVSAALDVEQKGKGVPSENIRDIVERIAPSIRPVIEANANNSDEKHREEILDHCIKANIQNSVDQLKHGSSIIETLINEGRLRIVGAEYLFSTGEVQFLYDSNEHRPQTQTTSNPSPKIVASKPSSNQNQEWTNETLNQ